MTDVVRILLVEDNPSVADQLSLTLGGLGFEVMVALDGREGEQLTRTFMPQLAIIEKLLPRRMGDDLAQQVATERGLNAGDQPDLSPDLPIRVVHKPFRFGELLAAIHGLLEPVDEPVDEPIDIPADDFDPWADPEPAEVAGDEAAMDEIAYLVHEEEIEEIAVELSLDFDDTEKEDDLASEEMPPPRPPPPPPPLSTAPFRLHRLPKRAREPSPIVPSISCCSTSTKSRSLGACASGNPTWRSRSICGAAFPCTPRVMWRAKIWVVSCSREG